MNQSKYTEEIELLKRIRNNYIAKADTRQSSERFRQEVYRKAAMVERIIDRLIDADRMEVQCNDIDDAPRHRSRAGEA